MTRQLFVHVPVIKVIQRVTTNANDLNIVYLINQTSCFGSRFKILVISYSNIR